MPQIVAAEGKTEDAREALQTPLYGGFGQGSMISRQADKAAPEGFWDAYKHVVKRFGNRDDAKPRLRLCAGLHCWASGN